MKWSKLKKLTEMLLADSVKEHLQFYVTRYGPGESDTMVRAWITWDKREIMNMSTIEWLMAYNTLEGTGSDHEMRKVALKQRGIYSRDDFYSALEEYIGLPIEAVLRSTNDIIKAWAMFDRRLGKRGLLKLQPIDVEHPVVRQFYDLRCQADDISI